MKTYGEGFDTRLEGLEEKPAALLRRDQGRQPGVVVLDPDTYGRTDPYGEPSVIPLVDQPRVFPGTIMAPSRRKDL